MIALQQGRITPLPCHPGCIDSLAYFGNGYALLDHHHRGVIRLDETLCPVGTTPTDVQYSNLCYDACGSCFWAVAAQDASVLYQLDLCFRPQRQVPLPECRLRGLCAMSCHDAIVWLVFPDCLLRVDTVHGGCRRIPCYGQDRTNLAILSLCGGRLVAYAEGLRQCVEILWEDCDERLEFSLPRGCCLAAMVLCGCHHEEEHNCMVNDILFLLSKPGNREYASMNCRVCGCAHDCSPLPCPLPPCGHHPCPPPPPPPPPHPHPCNGPCEIMHSIALEEAGIAHILNAEGEKLQKAVASTSRIDELLCVNESVKHMITQITQLEGYLYSKLETLLTSCDSGTCGCATCSPHQDAPHPIADVDMTSF